MFDGLIPALRSTRPARLELDRLDPIHRGLAGFWPLDETGGGVARDLSPYDNRGLGENNPTRGIVNGWRSSTFAGGGATSQNFNLGQRGHLTQALPFTFTGWVYPTDVGGNPRTLYSRYGSFSSAGGLINQVYLGNYIVGFGTTAAAGNYQQVASGFDLTYNAWNFIAVVVSGSYAAPTCEIFINKVRATPTLAAMSATVASGYNARIGSSDLALNYPSTEGLVGSLRLLRVFNRALNAAEINRLYLFPRAGTIDPAERLFQAFKSPTTSVTVALTGVAGTGAVGSVGPQTAVAMSGVVGTGGVGTVAPSLSLPITGVAGTGEAGTVGPVTSLTASGVDATGAVGSVVPSLALALTGVEGLAVVGDVSVAGDKTVALTGVDAAGAVGDVTALSGTVSGTLRRRGRYRVYRDVPVELAPAVDLASGYVEAEVERAVEDAMRRLRALSLKASVARRTALVQELNTQIVAAVARAAEADEEDAIALL